MEVTWLGHASFRIGSDVFIDPVGMVEGSARFVYITHTHEDHFDREALARIVSARTIVFCSFDAIGALTDLGVAEVIGMRPGMRIVREGVEVVAYPAYNQDKRYHPKEEEWLGFHITLPEGAVYVVGDSDALPELQGIRADLVLIPVSGTYVMDAHEAAMLAQTLSYEVIVPMHYGSVVGSQQDALMFAKLARNVMILEKDVPTGVRPRRGFP